MTSLYPATSAKSRAGIASAIQGSRPACQSRRTAASIISRSASGSAILPKLDSTRQRRASQPSIWSVTAATPKTIAAGQLCPPSALSSRTTKTGISASRTIVSALGICATGAGTARVATVEGYGDGGNTLVAGLRQCPFARLPARPARANRGRRLLGLARRDARARGLALGRAGAQRLRPGLPRDGRRRLHGGGRVSLPRPRRGARGGRGGGGGRDRARAAARGLWARRDRPLPAGLRRRLPLAARSRSRDGRSRRPRPPLHARVPARLARGARALRGRREPAAARPRRRAAARDRGVPRRARPPSRRAARGDRLPRAAYDGRARDPCRRAGARPAGRGERARLCVSDDRSEPRRRLRAGAGALRARDRNLHRLGLERAHRPARGAAGAGVHRPPPCRQAQHRLGLVAPVLRLGRGRRGCGPRALARRRGEPRAPVPGRRRGRPRGPRLRLLGGGLRLEKSPAPAGLFESGRRDLNSGPLVPQTSALTRLRHAPSDSHSSSRPGSRNGPPDLLSAFASNALADCARAAPGRGSRTKTVPTTSETWPTRGRVGSAILQRVSGAAPERGVVVRILVMDDHRLFASTLHARLEEDPRFEIVGVAADRDDVVRLAAEVEPHVVLLDAGLSDSAALDATRRIVRAEHAPRVLIMAGPENELDAVEAHDAGASAFLRTPRSTTDLIETLELTSILATAVPPDAELG